MPGKDQQSGVQQELSPTVTRDSRRSLAGPGADLELERAMLQRQSELSGQDAVPPPSDSSTPWLPGWLAEMIAWDGGSSTSDGGLGSPDSNVGAQVQAGTEGLSASGVAVSEVEDGRASAVAGGAHWSSDKGLGAEVAATRGQTVRTEDSETSWETESQSTSARASDGSEDWSSEVSRQSGSTTHYKGHEVQTGKRTAVSAGSEGLSLHRRSSQSVNDDGICTASNTSGSAGYSWEHGFNFGYGGGSSVSDGDDFQLSRSADLSVSHEAGRAGMTASSHVVDSDGLTHDGSRSGSMGWDPLGFLAEYRQSQGTSAGEDFDRRQSALAYSGEAFGAETSRASHHTAADGSVQTGSSQMGASLGAGALGVSGSRSSGYSWEGVEGTRSATGELSRDADGNTTGSLGASRALADGADYHDRAQMDASYQGGVVQVNGTSDVRYTDMDSVRHDQQRGAGASVGNGSASVTASQNQSTLDDGIGLSSTRSAAAGVGPDGAWHISGTLDRSVAMDQDYGQSRGVGATLRSDGLDLSTTNTARWTDTEGAAHTQSSGATLGLRDGQLTAGGQTGRTLRHTDGSEAQTSQSASLSTNGTASGSYSTTQRDAQGAVQSGHSVQGSADVFGDARSASAGGSMTRGKRTLSAGGGLEYEVNTPEERDGRWVVTYKQGISANGGGSGTAGTSGLQANGTPGASVGGGLSAGVQVMASGVRTFGTEAEATAFYERPDLGLMEGPSASIADVLAMRDGDSASGFMSGSLGANGSAGWGPFLTASAGVSGGMSSGMTVERGAGETVFVTVEDATTLAGQLGLSTIGVGLSGGVSERDFEAVTWSFDLSVPAAQEGYAAYVGEGQLPERVAGVTRESATTGSTEGSTQSVSLPGLSFSSNSESTASTTTLGNGDVLEEDTGSESFVATAAEFFGWDISEEHAMTFSELNGERRWMAAESVVDNSTANNSHAGLARAAGLPGEANTLQGPSSGRWTYETTFEADGMDTFIDAVEGRDYNAHSGMMFADDGEDMRAAIRAAEGDRDAQRHILAEFIKNSGHQGTAQIREQVGGSEGFLELEGSETFVGAEGHEEVTRELERVEMSLMEDIEEPSLLMRTMDGLLADLYRRHSDMTDYGQYRDVPPALRGTAKHRVEGLIAEAEAIRAEIVIVLVERGDGDVFLTPNQVSDDLGGLGDARTHARKMREDMDAAYGEARARRTRHEIGYPNARDALGGGDFWGLVGAGPEYGAYVILDDMWSAAEGLRREGAGAEFVGRDKGELFEQRAVEALSFWREATTLFGEAQEGFVGVTSAYDAIQSRHGDKSYLWRTR